MPHRRLIMKRFRICSVAAAILVTAIQWSAFFSPMLYTRALSGVDAAFAGDVSATDWPTIVVTGHGDS
jgi:hypothetical protein